MSTNTFAPASISGLSAGGGSLKKGDSAIIVGAGAFGGWTALHLLRRGIKVTLIDSWGAGNSRSSSGDETRVIRSTYGSNEFYFDLNVRSLQLWKEHQKQWNRQVFFNTGVLWLCHNEKTSIVDDSIPYSKKHRMEYEHLTKSTLASRYDLVRVDDLSHAWLDPYGGYLKARESTQLVAETFVAEGGIFINSRATPQHGLSLKLSDGQIASADTIIYACGSWLGRMFPKEIGNRVFCTRQEVFYFGTPPDTANSYDSFPVWIDADDRDYYYGIPGNANRGFKVGVDIRGPEFDPTNGDRTSNPAVLAHARNFLGHRFPGLKDAPLVESRVCPYENSPDGNFIFEQHPTTKNLWFLGGGSGHGFKHGPGLGELVAKSLMMGY